MERCGIDDVRTVAVVGDTRLDLEAGWNAGAPWRIGVLTGAHDRSMLEQGPYTHLLASATEVPGLWPA
jgi:phosphoglycolate phosphatase-like HAD superfamily hydrolase